MPTTVSVLEYSFTMSMPSSCFAVVWYNFCSVLFPLCLPSSFLDNDFGKVVYFTVAVVVMTAVGLSDELCRAKPGTLVATLFSAKFCFRFWKGFCFVFVIMLTAAIQLYCLMEPGTRTQKVKAEVQLITRWKTECDVSELDSLTRSEASGTQKDRESRCKFSSVLVSG